MQPDREREPSTPVSLPVQQAWDELSVTVPPRCQSSSLDAA
jgi:hypothetical protein